MKLRLKIAGYSHDDLLFCDPSIHTCGAIEDGVFMNFKDQGGWVLSFADLERAYKAAVKARKDRKP